MPHVQNCECYMTEGTVRLIVYVKPCVSIINMNAFTESRIFFCANTSLYEV